jgi:hypothetical protein
MRCAVLCNGPSRTSFQSRDGYDFVIGCNVPWTEVDATVVFDREIVRLLANRPGLIDYRIYFSKDAWMYTDSIKKRDLFKESFAGIIDPKYPFYSSGHGAVETVIKNGATEVHIYGCDSWFEYDLSSHTHQYSDTSYPNKQKCIDEWRKKWNQIIERNPNVGIQFIK